MKTATFHALVVGFAAVLCASARAEDLTEDKLMSLARESREAPSVPGVDSEIEHRALAAAGNFAFRGGPRLVLSLRDTTATFTDHSRCGEDHDEDCGIFKLVVYAPSRHLYVVQQSTDEYVIYLVVDRNGGNVGEFSPLPYLSPSGDFVVGTNYTQPRSSEEPGYPNPHLEISIREARGVHHSEWEGAPHFPKKGVARYVVDGWNYDDATIEPHDRKIEMEAHLEVDGKVKARFKVRKPANGEYPYKVRDIRR